MKRKLFVLSDIHGHYSEMKKALDDAGFDPENESHIFVSCGDLFDRGMENVAVYDFVRGLKHKILIRGNHEDMLYKTFVGRSLLPHSSYNGTDITIRQLLGEGAIDEDGRFVGEPYKARIGELMDFIDAMIDYYETDEYVLTHGWVPIILEDRTPIIDPNWRDASSIEWGEARWLPWQQLYETNVKLEGKTIVCGHRPARMGVMFDQSREPDDSSIFYGEGMIAIDAGTVRSGRVNILVIEEDLKI